MGDYSLNNISNRDFEHLIQSLAMKVIGPGVRIHGDGPDGAREITFEGAMPYPTLASPWNGYLVMQAKHCPRPTGDPGDDGRWALDQLAADLQKFNDPKRTLRRPEYYIFITNVVLTPVWEKGSQDKAFELLKASAQSVGLKGYDVWHYDKLCRFLDLHPEIRTGNNFLTSGDVVLQLVVAAEGLTSLPSRIVRALENSVSQLPIFGQGTKEDATTAPDVDAKAEIDRAGRYMLDGKLDVATDLLNDVEKDFATRLSPRGRFRLIANRGNIARMKGDFSLASKLYIEAKKYQPDDKEARFLEATAHHMLGEIQTAKRLADELLADFPEMPRAHVLQIALSPNARSVLEMQSALPPIVADDPEVLLMLAQRARIEGKHELVESLVRRVHAREPKWIMAIQLLVESILESLIVTGVPVELANESQVKRLREVIELVTTALSMPGFLDEMQELRLRLDRGIAFDALFERDNAMPDFHWAHQKYPDMEETAFRYGMLVAYQHPEDAIKLLKSHVNKVDCPLQTVLFYAQLIADRNGIDDRSTATKILLSRGTEWKTHQIPLQVSWVQTLVHLFIDQSKISEANSLLEEVSSSSIPAEVSFMLQASVSRACNDESKAIEFADKAAAAVTEKTHPDDVRRVATMLENIGKAEIALSLWKRIAPSDALAPATRHMLHCAQRCQNDDLIIDVCANLRKHNVLDRECFELEILALQHRSPLAARDLTQLLLQSPVEESVRRALRLRLAMIGIYIKQSDIIEITPSLLPRVDEVNASTGRAVISTLLAVRSTATVEYAYELFRRFPDEFDAHMAVVESFGITQNHGRGPQIETPEVVKEGCAVCIAPVGTKKREWWIIEDSANPSLTRNERAASDPVVKKALGLAKGAKFVLRDAPLPIEAKIVEIESKFVFRWRDCFSGMESRFSLESPIWSINIVRGKGKYDFTAFLQELDRQSKINEERDSWYRDHLVPISMFAKTIGKSVIEVMSHVMSTPDLPVRCSNGSQEEIQSTMLSLEGCHRIVVDSSAIATLFLTDTISWLEHIPLECVVTEHTVHNLKRMAMLDHPVEDGLRTMGKVDGRYTHTEWTPEQLKAYQDRLKALLQAIETHCSIVQGSSLSALNAGHRQILCDSCGRDIAESIVEAAISGSMLWTDDLTISDLAKFSLPVRRVWTQAMFAWLQSKKIIEESVAERLALNLYHGGFHFTSLSGGAILLCGAENGWDVDKSAFSAVLNHFVFPNADMNSLIGTVGFVLRGVWQRGLVAFQTDIVTFRVLKLLDSRTNGRKLILTIIKNAVQLFGGDTFNAQRFVQSATTWVSLNKSTQLILPPQLGNG